MGKYIKTPHRIKQNDLNLHDMVNITSRSHAVQMAYSRKKFSYLAIFAGVVMLVMTFAAPPAFAAEGGDSGLSKPILAAGMGIIAEKPEKFGQVLFFFVIPETLWIIGFVLGIILLLDIL